VHGTHTITGTYKIQWLVTYQQTGISADADSNTILTLPGPLNKNYANFVAGATQWVDDNTNAGFTWAPTVATNTTGKRYAFVSSTPSSLPNVTAPATVSATYKTQYYLTITTNPGDVPRSTQVTPADGWYDDNGVNISLTAALSYTAGGGTGYTFKNWTGDVPGSPNTSDPLSVPMNQPRTVVANYTTWGLTWGTNTYTAQYSGIG
jgi:hypothetical protein